MFNSNKKNPPKIFYTVSSVQMLKFIETLPTLLENRKHTEYHLSVPVRDGNIPDQKSGEKQITETESVSIHFSYDFVQDRWFLNDKRIRVTE